MLPPYALLKVCPILDMLSSRSHRASSQPTLALYFHLLCTHAAHAPSLLHKCALLLALPHPLTCMESMCPLELHPTYEHRHCHSLVQRLPLGAPLRLLIALPLLVRSPQGCLALTYESLSSSPHHHLHATLKVALPSPMPRPLGHPPCHCPYPPAHPCPRSFPPRETFACPLCALCGPLSRHYQHSSSTPHIAHLVVMIAAARLPAESSNTQHPSHTQLHTSMCHAPLTVFPLSMCTPPARHPPVI